MGLAQALGWTAAHDFIEPRRNTLIGLGAGLLQGRPGSGVMEGRMADDANAIRAKEEAARQANINQTAQWARTQFPELANAPDELVAQMAPSLWEKQFTGGATDPTSTYEGRLKIGQYQGLTGTDLTTYALTGNLPTGRGAAGEVSLQPTWMQDAQGKWVLGQMTKDGTVIQSDIPDGMTVAGPYEVNATKAAGTAFGRGTGDAQFDLPAAKLTVDQTIDALKEIRDNSTGMDQNFGNIMGVPTQVVPAYPGSSMSDFRNSVTRGANLAFMQAREMLRGGGQITDFESKKAESAITDMQIAMQSGSKQQFLKALDDFEKAVKDGYAKLQSQAAAIPGYGNSAPAPSGGTDYKSKYGLE